ncbi:MAG: phosphoribosylglycinamide formyltransferase [Clostridia bacterium]|nr:phosphoribosylglycinamide formyltransferase [Clostridia bacterium]
MKKIVVLVSGGGTNLQALIDAKDVIVSGKITKVISSKPDVYALERAKNAGIPGVVIARKSFADNDSYQKALLSELKAEQPDLIVLAGFLSIIGEEIIKEFPEKIINVHPSLIPSFCGDGFYGLKVHEAALEKGVKVTGATVHFVNEITDGGRIILQQPVMVEEGDTPEVLQRRVMEQAEWKILPKACELVLSGKA